MLDISKLKMRNKREFRNKLIDLLEEYELMISNTDVRYREYMRRECEGSIRSLREILTKLGNA
jgi:hypothetical protein